jgi:hypothetical protein
MLPGDAPKGNKILENRLVILQNPVRCVSGNPSLAGASAREHHACWYGRIVQRHNI